MSFEPTQAQEMSQATTRVTFKRPARKMMRSRSRSTSRTRGKKARSNTTPGFSTGSDVGVLVPRIVRAVHPLSPFPQKKRLTLKYADSLVITTPTGSTTYRQWKVNSLYDCDGTGTGHQPRFYDNWLTSTGPYTVYRVLGVRAKVTLAQSENATIAQSSALLCAGFSTGATNPAAPSGSANSNIWAFTEIPGWSGAVVPVGDARSLSFQRTIADIFGVSPAHILGEDNYQGFYNTDPVNICYFYIAYQAADFAVATNGNLSVHFEFDVQLENPLFLANS